MHAYMLHGGRSTDNLLCRVACTSKVWAEHLLQNLFHTGRKTVEGVGSVGAVRVPAQAWQLLE